MTSFRIDWLLGINVCCGGYANDDGVEKNEWIRFLLFKKNITFFTCFCDIRDAQAFVKDWAFYLRLSYQILCIFYESTFLFGRNDKFLTISDSRGQKTLFIKQAERETSYENKGLKQLLSCLFWSYKKVYLC